MKRSSIFAGTGAAAGMLLLILDGRTALAGARAGLAICLEALIPTLFPFFVLSGLFMSAFSGAPPKFLRPVGRICQLPPACDALLLPGLLGGYPVGAQTVSAAWKDGFLSRDQAERLLCFCSNAGPSFIFGICGPLFPKPWMAWALLGIHILSAVVTARLFSPPEGYSAKAAGSRRASFGTVMPNALRAMAAVCGWVILFRVVVAFLRRWLLWLLPGEAQAAVIGILELANGCLELRTVSSVRLRFVLCSGLLALGGLCVAMQTASVCSGLSIQFYLRGKLTQALVSLLLAGLVAFPPARPPLLVLAALVVFFTKKQKSCSFSTAAGV